ncbi:ABC transporter substrate-binding protein [Xaviernesmea oryzae]|uniref:Peptide/nickel transport system substrate-binding protein n=1 Tax=Xaviernesmea oryzae TaxID=464029 RepID=A0A1X7DUL8_9HYPH|nr:ABC transporter substrate-binding protein [Xaviernesmea oryzae]SMF21976.1 peptide/nickel transport system substrate-binding protein [Xaviernesmea oryzae]
MIISERMTEGAVSRRGMLKGTAALMATMSLPGFVRAASDAPLYGGVFIVGAAEEPRHLNLNTSTDIAIKLIANPIFSKLVGLKSDLTTKPDLAKSWTVSEDKLVYTFNLHDGVKWHDGEPFGAADVKFSFEKILFPLHNVGKTLQPFVKSVEAPDATTVVFTLNSPNDYFVTFVAGQGFIQPRHIYEGTDFSQNPANLRPVGTGPFKFSNWRRGQELEIVRNENYFLKDQPYVDRIVTRFIPEPSARINALVNGEVDYVTYADLPPSMVAELRKNKDLVVTSAGHEAWGSLVELMMNLDKEPFSKLEVRQAIAHAVNRDFIIEKAVYGLAKPATGPISSQLAWAYTPDTIQYPYDVAKANALLDKAGYPRGADGVRFSTSVTTNRSTEAFVKAAQIIAEQLKAVGIAVTVNALDTATVNEMVFTKREFGMYVNSLTTGPDPAMGVQRQYVSANIRPVPNTNAIGYRNPVVDKLLGDAAHNPSREERAKLYKDVSRILCEDVAMVWLYENPTFSAFNARFGNLHTWAAESIYAYGDVYWKEGNATRG